VRDQGERPVAVSAHLLQRHDDTDHWRARSGDERTFHRLVGEEKLAKEHWLTVGLRVPSVTHKLFEHVNVVW
jgi:hypothetical protein